MGNSPSSNSEDTDDDQEKPTVHPEQTTFEESSSETESVDEGDGTSTTGAVAGGVAAGVSPTFPENEVPEDNEESESRDEQLPEDEGVAEETDSSSEAESEEPKEGESEEDDSEEEEVQLFVYTDPWDTAGWANEPELRDLEVTYPGCLNIHYKPLPPRLIDRIDRDQRMPKASTVETPNQTETSHRALRAADNQGRFRPFLRRLRIAALSEGRDIEDETVLLELASEMGLDTNQLRTEMEQIEVPDSEDTTPRIEGLVGGEPHRWTGRIEAKRLKVRFVGEGIEPEPTTVPLRELVDRHEPVTRPELHAAYDKVPSDGETIRRIEIGDNEYWVLVNND